ncbi:hypothetical protein niasHT_015142 [Heterodera trifolii]|uniref:Abnormal cell migration protein 18-like fibronectin type I domain-containing protein n=1 Tax=Heterodera trifolii TaxID=157864 RepID=A0ABD2L9T1_9BILA
MFTVNSIVHLLLTCCLLLAITDMIISDSLPQNATVADQPTETLTNQTVAAAETTAATESTAETTNATTAIDQLNVTVNESTETTVTQSSSPDPTTVINSTSTEQVELIADADGGTDQALQTFNTTVQPSDLGINATVQPLVLTSEIDQQSNVTLQNATATIIEPVALIAATENGTDQTGAQTLFNATAQQIDQNNNTTVVPLIASTNEPNITLNFTVESMHLITDNGTDLNRTDEAGAAGPSVAGGELGGEVPLVSSGQADEQNAKNESANSNGTASAVSSGTVVDTTKFIPHGDDDCWTDQNGEDTPRWFANGDQIERGIVWYECQKGKLVTQGCIDENGKRLKLNGTYQSGRYRMKCMPFGENARRQVIGCVPDGQLDKTYMPGESWVDNEKQIWWQCVLENAWLGGCVDEASGNRLNVGDAIDRNLTTYECQHKHFDGFRMVPIGCIFDGTRYSVGLYWQDDDFVFYCKLQQDDAGTEAASSSCIECILRNQRLFNEDNEFQDEHAKKCAQRLAPEGYTMCTR